jgi:hypothetical protein
VGELGFSLFVPCNAKSVYELSIFKQLFPFSLTKYSLCLKIALQLIIPFFSLSKHNQSLSVFYAHFPGFNFYSCFYTPIAQFQRLPYQCWALLIHCVDMKIAAHAHKTPQIHIDEFCGSQM